MKKVKAVKKTKPAQHQKNKPGHETKMTPQPESFMERYRPALKLRGKVALITGGDSGIGRAVAIAYAKEGADVAFIYLNEKKDAEITRQAVEAEGVRCLPVKGDVSKSAFCNKIVADIVKKWGKINILVNNAAEQQPQENITDITDRQLHKTFATNFFGAFYMARAAAPHMKRGDCIINTASITAYKGNDTLIDYSSTKGALVSFTRSLSLNLVGRGIRVNGVAPGPIWTPLIPSTFPSKRVKNFGADVPMKRPGEPDEVAPCFVFLASDDSSYISGQFLHPNGGWSVNG